MIATLTLNPSIDQQMIVEKLVTEDTNRALEIHSSPGGKGVNVSRVIHELGGSTRAHTLLGGDTGGIWEGLADKFGVPYCVIPVPGQTRINVTLTDLKSRKETKINAPGPRVSSEDFDRVVSILKKVRPTPSFWVLGGSLCPGLPKTAYRTLIQELQKKGVRCALDADEDVLKEGIKAGPFLIKPNQYEFERLIGRTFQKKEDYVGEARKLVVSGIPYVIISLAQEGALFVSRDEAFQAKGPEVAIKSRVGAGDSLVGGVLHVLSRGGTLKEAAKTGIAASTSTVMRQGPRLCRKQDIPGLLKKIKITPF